MGNILTQTDSSPGNPNAGTTTFTYDALYRLSSADAPGTVNDEAYTYDEVGNRLTATKGSIIIGAAGSSTRYYDILANSNRLSQIHLNSATGTIESAFVYDNEGRLTSQSGSTPRTLTWDAKGRLKTLTQSSITETYSYDPTDHRIRRSGGTLGNLDYYLEGEHLESVEQNGSLQEKYFRGASIDELVAGYIATSASNPDLTPVLYQHDATMSVAAISEPNGGTVQTSGYSPFGGIQSQTGTSTNRLGYTGREDDGTGLYYYRARYYDSSIGRFLSEDPLGFKAGINFYAYVGNNPVNANDPTGMDTQITIGYTHTIAPGLSHQLVILTDTVTGAQYATRAGPECALCGGLGAGSITAVSGSYDSTFKWDPPKSVYTTQEVGVIKRDYRDSVNNAIDFANVTNQNKISYWPLGPNSNSYASTFVESLTGTRPAPIVTAPGADMGQPSSKLNFSPSPIINTGGATGSWGSGATGSWDSSSAAGGFLLYPNKPNTNQMQSVYIKP